MAKFKFYAVRRGHTTGVFDRWYGIGGAEEAIDDYPGAEFKGFQTAEAARIWLAGKSNAQNEYDKLIDDAINGDANALERAEMMLTGKRRKKLISR
jgi:ribonuclease HI